MTRYALHAGQFVLAGALRKGGFLTIEDGRCGAWSAEAPDCDLVDNGDAWIAPGFVDTHIHGYFGHATTDIDATGLLEAGVELARRGTTSWLPTTFTDSADRIGAACEAIADASDRHDEHPLSAHIQGIYLEGPFFTMKHAGAQNPAYLIDPSTALFDTWQRKARGYIRKSAFAPERNGATAYCSYLVAQHIVACIGHTDATYTEGLAAVDVGASVFVHTYNGMRGLHHREPGVVGCAMTAQNTYAELICDGYHVAPAAAAALVRAKGWEHVVLITDCLGCGGLPEGAYMSGGLPVVMKDGVCYLSDMSGMAGSILTLAEAVKNVVDWGLVTAEQAIRMASEVAARSAGIDDVCGVLRVGRAADFVVLNPDMTLRATYMGGELVR